MRRKGHPIPARASRKGGRRACLCMDGTYSIKCCDGSIMAQGIGSLIAQTNQDMECCYIIKHASITATVDTEINVVYSEAFPVNNEIMVEGRSADGEAFEVNIDASDVNGFTITPTADGTVTYFAISDKP